MSKSAEVGGGSSWAHVPVHAQPGSWRRPQLSSSQLDLLGPWVSVNGLLLAIYLYANMLTVIHAACILLGANVQ